MRKIETAQYSEFIAKARANTANQIYPASIAEGIQEGDIYVSDADDAAAVLFWHYCGFAFITGEPSERFLRQLSEDVCFSQDRRMVLITHDEAVVRFFKDRGYETGGRIEYCYGEAAGRAPESDAASGHAPETESVEGEAFSPFRLERIDRENYDRITGRISPRFSWQSAEEFLKKSFGFAAFEGDTYCGTAFASGISSKEADIGVEVVPEYRGRGLASALVRRACAEALARGKQPVWDHHASNIASGRTARRCGFVQKQVNTFISVKSAGK
ncbi:MAG: GNAT family N-acetyltransferase [Lachnospiraceae bacterium]|nr:GNAT family N-acetyltransferase [Lachnospiraceae bacterium]